MIGRKLLAVFWALYALVYDKIWDSPLTTAIADVSLRFAVPNANVVDLGCGTGLISGHLLRSGCNVTGVDFSRSMLRRAMSKKRLVSPVHSDAEDSNLASGCADLVLLCNVLHVHSDAARLVVEAARLAKPSSIIFICGPVGGLRNSTLVGVELSLGRGLGGVLIAHLLRSTISRLARLTGVRPDGARSLRSVLQVAEKHSLKVVHSEVLFGCQAITVLRTPE